MAARAFILAICASVVGYTAYAVIGQPGGGGDCCGDAGFLGTVWLVLILVVPSLALYTLLPILLVLSIEFIVRRRRDRRFANRDAGPS